MGMAVAVGVEMEMASDDRLYHALSLKKIVVCG